MSKHKKADQVAESRQKVRMEFPGMHPTAWQHPADRAALQSLQKVPGLDVVLRTFFGGTTERSLRLMALASSVRVGPRQFSRVHELTMEACRVFAIESAPEVYVAQNPFLNAGAVGMDHPFIVLNSGLVESVGDEELLGVIGHELGHILSGHVLYKSLLSLMLQFSTLTLNIPLSGVAIAAIIAALKEWDRKSELSADRAELLTVQNPETCVRLLMKMAGGNRTDQMELGEFIRQAEEYNQSETMMDSFYKLLNLMGQTHPFPVIRVVELLSWVRSGEYDAIMRGFYAKEKTELADDWKKAGQNYAKDFQSSFRPVGETLENAAQKAMEIFEQLRGERKA